ncbi:MAG: AAA family ATPase [Flavobacteriales bacterium]
MFKVTNEFRESVLEELMVRYEIYERTDKMFARKWAIPETSFNSLKTKFKNGLKGYSSLLSEMKWIGLGRALGVYSRTRKWNTAETDVFLAMRQELMFCKEESRSMIFCDDADIGKTETAKVLAATLPETYHIDCSRAKSKGEFLRLIAREIGLPIAKKDRHADIFDTIVYGLSHFDRPLVILDEAGDLSDSAFLEIKALWNATEHSCGWYAMGAEGFAAKLERGFDNKKLGIAEFLRRFGAKISTIVPKDAKTKQQFYRKLITQVLLANMKDEEKPLLDKIVNQCLANHGQDRMGCLTRAENLLIVYTRPEASVKK